MQPHSEIWHYGGLPALFARLQRAIPMGWLARGSSCKYLELRIDMRFGWFILKDANGRIISVSDFEKLMTDLEARNADSPLKDLLTRIGDDISK